MEKVDDTSKKPKDWFATTHWSVVVEARQDDSGKSRLALELLCNAYWYPLYAYVRRRGYSVQDAEDLTQEFFTRLLEKKYLDAVDRKRGKFRTFLLSSLENFLAKEWRASQRLKRGGGRVFLSIDQWDPEKRYEVEPVDRITPEELFERRWATSVLNQAMDQLKIELESRNKLPLFEALRHSIACDRNDRPHAELAMELNMSESALNATIHRLRKRYGALLREQVAQTVCQKDQVEEEIRHLLAALKR